ncbi:MAG: hypothetical protein M1831_005397 [Alyxoria varia]|nr:MAG: hypothetical protein M1831_005397 [Alyxoria varia]
MQTVTQPAPRLRSLYRSLLRELPSRKPSLLANRSPILETIRERISATPSSASDAPSPPPSDAMAQEHALQATAQITQYLRAQRLHTALLERYNPGMNNLGEEDRVRLTARRVGMDLPEKMKAVLQEYNDGDGRKGNGED